MPILTKELKKAIDQSGEAPLHLTDSETNSEYILIRAEVYERMRASCEGFDVRAMYPIINELAAREGWDEPAMDVYNEYEPPSA
jgi:hypothetical protein